MNIDKIKQSIENEIKDLKILSKNSKVSRNPVELDQQSIGRLTRIDAIQQQQLQIASEKNRLNRINLLNATLKRIETGNFGYCIICEEDIPFKRLLIDPVVIKCTTCGNY